MALLSMLGAMTACQSILGLEERPDRDAQTTLDAPPPLDAQAPLDAPLPPRWVDITGGTFEMGAADGDADEQPVHTVTVPSFQLGRTEVTVAEYRECMDASQCTEPASWEPVKCYWDIAGYEDHPVNCVDWQQAAAYCAWAGGRLPSEAEWEYAARSQGQEITYPWGNEPASCDYAVMNDGGNGCGTDLPWAVCSKDAGNTSQGLCDMAGNVFEWTQDNWHANYDGAPTDGSAWEGGSNRLVRSGSYEANGNALRAAARGTYFGESYNNLFIGLRCARDAP